MLTCSWLRSLEDIDSKGKSFWSDIRACGVVCQRTSHYHRLAPRKTRQRLFAPPKTCQRRSGQRGYARIWVTTKDKNRIIKIRKLIACQWAMINWNMNFAKLICYESNQNLMSSQVGWTLIWVWCINFKPCVFGLKSAKLQWIMEMDGDLHKLSTSFAAVIRQIFSAIIRQIFSAIKRQIFSAISTRRRPMRIRESGAALRRRRSDWSFWSWS